MGSLHCAARGSRLCRFASVAAFAALFVCCAARDNKGNVEGGKVYEASGLIKSRKNEGLLWTHNDSGDWPRVLAIDTQGRVRGEYTVWGASASDWEDIAMSPKGELCVFNNLYSNYAEVFCFAEPSLDMSETRAEETQYGGVDATKYGLTFPDGQLHNTEAFIVGHDGTFIVVTKGGVDNSYLFKTDKATPGETVTLEKVRDVRLNNDWAGPVAGDVSPSGDLFVLKSYGHSLYAYDVDGFFGAGEPTIYSIEYDGAEAIAFDDENCVYTLAEGNSSPLYHYCLF